MFELRAVTKDNFEDIISLSVTENQIPFVPSNVYSIAQAGVYKETAFPFGIFVNDNLVGFVMVGYHEIEKQHKLWRLMIDKNHQGKGYGKSALKFTVDYMIKHFKIKELETRTHCDNIVAQNLYKSIGFKEIAKEDGNQIKMKLLIKDYKLEHI